MASPLDDKARSAIAILMDRRKTWSLITYGDLGDRVDHPAHFLGPVLDRVGDWCRSISKRSLALLVVDEGDGKPRPGMFGLFPGEVEAVTLETYERQRVRLWRETWEDVALPTAEKIAEAYLPNTH